MDDRRKAPRILVQFNITMSFSGGQTAGEGHLINLSPGGAALRSDKPLSKGDFLTLRIFPPGWAKPIAVESAVVRWVEGRDFGLEFLKVQAAEAKRLHRVLSPLVELIPAEERAKAAEITKREEQTREKEKEIKEEDKKKEVDWFG
jgi:hypothetical protein